MVFIILIFFSVARADHSYFQGIELLSDVNYSQGFDVIPACPSDPTGCATAPRYRLYNPFSTAPNKSATWQLAQWWSHSNISTTGTFIDDGKSKGMQWLSPDKRFVLFQDYRLRISVDGFHEYGGQYKPRGDAWPAFLLQQSISIAGGAVPLNQVTDLRWDLNIQLLYMNQHIQPGYDSNIHAAIFPLYLAIQNLVQGDSDYGKYFWLGICLYDDRVLMSPLYINGDKGTGSLIYQPPFSNFANVSVHSGSVVPVTGNMIPFVRLGLQAAVERGFLKSDDLSKYYVGGMNIGWEVTGLNNGTIEIGNFSLKQYTAQNPKSYEFNHDGDADGWRPASDNGPVNGKWIVVPKGNDPQLLSPVLMLDTSIVKKIIINMANDHLSDNHLQLFWSTDEEGLFDEDDSIWIEMKNDGRWSEYVLNLSNNSRWTGIVRRLRIDPVRYGNSGGFGIDYIRFAPH